MKKLKAFTLVELVVVMIISSITLATLYTVYLLVKKQYFRQSYKIESLNNYMQFKNTLETDILKADSIREDEATHSLLCYIDTTVVEYGFSERIAIRRYDNFNDSFVVFPHNLMVTKYVNSDLINYVSLKLIPFRDTVLVDFTKQYDANSLIKIKSE